MAYKPLQLPCNVLENPDGTFTLIIRGTLYPGFTLVYNADTNQFIESPILKAGEY